MTHPLTLAVVEDDDDVRVALGRLLRLQGHEVQLFSSTEEFERNRTAVDCLILDVRLPSLNGYDYYFDLQRRNISLPLVFITGDNSPRNSSEPGRIKAPMVMKPFELETLMEAVNSVVSKSRRDG